jgi:trigger factor
LLKSCEDVTSTRKRLTIEIPSEATESAIKKALLDLQHKTRMPGFRPGKAPFVMIEKRFGKEVEAEVLDKLVPDYFLQAVKEAGVIPVSRPEMDGTLDFRRNEPLSMTVTLDVRPVVEELVYEGIAVNDIPVEITEEEVQTVISNLIEDKATYEPVEDEVSEGDLVTVDYTEKVDEAVAKDVVFKVGEGPFPREFYNAFIGKKKDEECSAEVSFPQDSKTPFAGKETRFELKIKEIKRRCLPVLDDEFAKDLGLEDLKSLTDKVRENMTALKIRETDMLKHKEILGKLIETHDFDVPESLLNSQLEAMVRNRADNDERPDEALSAELRPDAERRVRASVLLEIIGEKEGVAVSEEEMKSEILALAGRFYVSPENVVKYYTARDGSLAGLRNSVFERKVMDLLLSKATLQKGGQ